MGQMVPAPDTLIVALATPRGRGALALVRLTGAGALDVVARLARRPAFAPRVATLVRLHLPPEGLAETAIVTVFTAPHSFTGQDSVEISTHGSPVIVDAVVRACLDAGARLARPGEFTWRAYLNGRLDLLQAEAVADLVAATTTAQVRVASAHLEGTLSDTIRAIGDEIARLRVLLEASLDFPDEGFHFIDPSALTVRIARVRESCATLLGSAEAGRRLHDGALVVVAGRPNAGKSSLFNALLGRQRAIVTAEPGTTRDLLTETASFGGVPVTLVDTAGLREAQNAIEREGVTRAEASVASADLVLLVVDPGAPPGDLEQSRQLWSRLDGRARLCVINKVDQWGERPDLRPVWCPSDAVAVSTREGAGIDVLEVRLGATLGQTTWEAATLTRARHRSLVGVCAAALERAERTASEGGSEEYILADLHEALTALEDLRGVESSDEVLDAIFSSFCIGK
jgi:tRNA modification GTPase